MSDDWSKNHFRMPVPGHVGRWMWMSKRKIQCAHCDKTEDVYGFMVEPQGEDFLHEDITKMPPTPYTNFRYPGKWVQVGCIPGVNYPYCIIDRIDKFGVSASDAFDWYYDDIKDHWFQWGCCREHSILVATKQVNDWYDMMERLDKMIDSEYQQFIDEMIEKEREKGRVLAGKT